MISKVPDKHKKRVIEIYNKVIMYEQKMTLNIKNYLYNIVAENEHKTKQLLSVKQYPKMYQKHLYNELNSKKYNLLKSKNNKYITMKEIEEHLNE